LGKLLHQILKAVAVALLASSVLAQAPKAPSLQQLYEQHRWFELRDAIAGKPAPALYAGAVASAFNHSRDAETLLKRAVREAATPAAANDAREALVNLYMRLGRSSEMVGVLDEALRATPSNAEIRTVRDTFESFRRLPDQTARLGRHRPFPCGVSASGVVLPAVVNGKPVEWLFDSGFSHSAMSESEARMLGIAVNRAIGSAGDFAGGTAPMRTGLVARMTIGDAELRNVPALVFPDSQPPWNEQAPGKRGTIGLPVALALQGIGWTKGGTCRVGPDPIGPARSEANLAFDGGTPVIRAQFNGAPLELVLDTGNQGGTQLWERFTHDFPQVVSAGRKATKSVEQIGGAGERQVVVLPRIVLRIAGFDGVLQPANVFSKPVGNDLQHGNLGVDVLSEAADVSIDFRAMSVRIR
jgi:hypothetical protein